MVKNTKFSGQPIFNQLIKFINKWDIWEMAFSIRRLGRKNYQHVVSFKTDNISREAGFFKLTLKKRRHYFLYIEQLYEN